MIQIPAWIIAVLFVLYGGEYLIRFFEQGRINRYIALGKAIVRFIFASTYLYFAFFPVPVETRVSFVRFSLLIFVVSELFFLAQERIMRRFIR
jgi:hypothetical protein